jgi:hypothetical protein
MQTPERWFVIADLVLDDGTFHKDVVFNSDTRVADKYYGKRTIAKMLFVRDATDAERKSFELENRVKTSN